MLYIRRSRDRQANYADCALPERREFSVCRLSSGLFPGPVDGGDLIINPHAVGNELPALH